MFSKVFSKVSQYQQLTSLQSRAFRASAIANSKKPSIGDAVTILQSKVSGINQVVSALALPPSKRSCLPRVLNRTPFMVPVVSTTTLLQINLTRFSVCAERLEGVRFRHLHR